ncbi:major facilitator superfamily domain-containing protein [Lobosporangium transversale]|uniref:Major facilitator superfamily domain-containing protein n=1 Tax=Lobosporangium transversale TaxID=64571 RepID=A0A1Y2G9P9_9FUNG|nr:major facilitator superfamily domain-containing protein [Lobosporangium transversale]ORZ04965.1 major facilitator superfamily domain-containing protein [Lobosporangium transversale]|eukprot:XP_021876829.1 major facilitator superfamily domain-containing protein [Lobosporangium transversale]
MFMAALDNSIVSTALPRIGTEFAGSNKVELVFTCYIITANAFQGLWGRCSNIFGRKPIVFLVVGIFVLGSILSGASRSMNMFLGCRALTGTGAGGIFSLANIIIADLVSIRDRGKYQGFISAVFGISALLGPVMGGAFVDKVSWRWCFYIQVALGAITLPTMAIMLKLPRPKGNVWEKLKAIDWAGTFFMAIFTVFLLLPTNLGGTMFPWNSPLIITLYALVIPTAAAFYFVEARYAKHPIVPSYLWRNRNVVTLFGLNVFMGMTFWTLIFYLPIYFQIVEHETATAAGLTMIPLEAGIFISSNIAGILVSKYGKYRPYIFTGTGGALIGIGLCLVLATTSSKIIHVVILLVSGLGIGQLFPCLIVAIQASVERKDLATVSALHNFFRMSGSGFGVAINGALFQNHLKNGLRDAQVPAELAAMAISSSQKIVHLPVEWRGIVEAIYLDSMKTVFKATIPMAAIMFLLTFNLKHVRLNIKSTTDADTGSGTATPKTSGNDEKTMITNDATTATTTAAETTTTTTTTKANM